MQYIWCAVKSCTKPRTHTIWNYVYKNNIILCDHLSVPEIYFYFFQIYTSQSMIFKKHDLTPFDFGELKKNFF